METIEKQRLDLSNKIDELITDLKNKFLSLANAKPVGTGPDGKVGIWDNVKSWWSKLRYGKFGNLGQVESEPKKEEPKTECIQFSLQEYRVLKNSCDELSAAIGKNQESLNEEESENIKNLKLFRIIDGWGNKFKQVILDLVYPQTPEPPVVSPDVGVRGAVPTIGPASSNKEERERAAARANASAEDSNVSSMVAAVTASRGKTRGRPPGSPNKPKTTEAPTTTEAPKAQLRSKEEDPEGYADFDPNDDLAAF